MSFGIRTAQIIQTIGIGLGLLGMVVLIFLPKVGTAGALQIILFQAFWVFVALGAGFFKKFK